MHLVYYTHILTSEVRTHNGLMVAIAPSSIPLQTHQPLNCSQLATATLAEHCLGVWQQDTNYNDTLSNPQGAGFLAHTLVDIW